MKHLLESARCEILALRRHNEILRAKVEVVDAFAAALGLTRREGGMSPDVAWEISGKIREIEIEEAEAKAAGAAYVTGEE